MRRLVVAVGFFVCVAAPGLAYINSGLPFNLAKQYERLRETDPKAAEEFRRKHLPEKTRPIDSVIDERTRLADKCEHEVLSAYHKAVRASPTSNSYYRRGRALLEHRDVADSADGRAVDDFGAAIKLNPAFAMAYLGRGVSLLNVPACRDLAFRDFKDAAQLEPDNVVIHSCAAIAHSRPDALADPKLALQHATIACRLTKHADPVVLQVMAFASYRNRNLTDAVKYQQAAMRRLPADGPESEQAQLRFQAYRDRGMADAIDVREVLRQFDDTGSR